VSCNSIALGLSFVEVGRLYHESSRQWIVTLDVLKELETKVKVLIESVKETDVVLYRTMKPLDQRDHGLSLPIKNRIYIVKETQDYWDSLKYYQDEIFVS